MRLFNPAAAVSEWEIRYFQWPITWEPLRLRRSGFLHLKALCQAQAVSALICGVGVVPEAGRSSQSPQYPYQALDGGMWELPPVAQFDPLVPYESVTDTESTIDISRDTQNMVLEAEIRILGRSPGSPTCAW